MLKNEPLDAKIAVDTAENEPPKGSKKCMLKDPVGDRPAASLWPKLGQI